MLKNIDSSIITYVTGSATMDMCYLVDLTVETGTYYFSDRVVEVSGNTYQAQIVKIGPFENSLELESDSFSIELGNADRAISALFGGVPLMNAEVRVHIYFPAINKSIRDYYIGYVKELEITDDTAKLAVSFGFVSLRYSLPKMFCAANCQWDFNDGYYCPYATKSLLPVGSRVHTTCTKTREACIERGMLDTSTSYANTQDYYGGIALYALNRSAKGKLNNTGLWGIGRKSYTSTSSPSDSIISEKVPLGYGSFRTTGKTLTFIDESEFMSAEVLVCAGEVEKINPMEVCLNSNKVISDYERDDFHISLGKINQERFQVDNPGHLYDGLSGKAFVHIRVTDSVGVAPSEPQGDIIVRAGRKIKHFTSPTAYTVKASTNPAWVLYDLVTDKHFGLGIASGCVDMDEFLTVAAHCDENIGNTGTVTNPTGAPSGEIGIGWEDPTGTSADWEGTIDPAIVRPPDTGTDYSVNVVNPYTGYSDTVHRYTWNGIVDGENAAPDVIKAMLDDFRAYAYISQGQLRIKNYLAMPSGYVPFKFYERYADGGEPNIIVDSMTVSKKDESEVPNQIVVAFADSDRVFEGSEVTITDTQAREEWHKIVDESYNLMGTSTVDQAGRIAALKMREAKYMNLYCTFKTDVRAVFLEPGDIIEINSTLIPNNAQQKYFRITKITLNDDFSVEIESRVHFDEVYTDSAEALTTFTNYTGTDPLATPPPVTINSDEVVEFCNMDVQGKVNTVVYVPYTLPLVDSKVPAPTGDAEDLRAPQPLWSYGEVYWADLSSVPSGVDFPVSYNYAGITKPNTSPSGGMYVDGAYLLELPFQGNRNIEIVICSVSKYGVTVKPNSNRAARTTYLLDGVTDPPEPITNLTVCVPTGMVDTFEIGFDPSSLATLYHVQYTTGTSFSEPAALNSGNVIVPAPGSFYVYTTPSTVTEGSTIKINMVDGKFQLRIVKTVESGFVNNGVSVDLVRFDTAVMVPKGTYTFSTYLDFNLNMGTLTIEDPYNFFEFIGKVARIKHYFRQPDSTLIFRVYAVNQFGYSPATSFLTPTSTSTYVVDYDIVQAPNVSGFTVVDNPFNNIYGADKILLTLNWTEPNPVNNYSHIKVFASAPIKAGDGIPAQEGYAGPGYYNYTVGEFWETGQTIIVDCTGDLVYFYAVSVNAEGYYDTDWFTKNYYQATSCTLDGSDSPPSQVTGAEIDLIGSGTLMMTWIDSAEYDINTYELEITSCTGETFSSNVVTETYVVSADMTHFAYSISLEKNNWYFRFRVRAVDSIGNIGTYSAYSNVYHGYCAAAYEMCGSPTNLAVTQYPVTVGGLTQMVWTVSWDNPSPLGNYGGSEVWICNASDSTRSELKARVSIDFTNNSDALFLMPVSDTAYKVALYPFNRFGIVPDYSQYVITSSSYTPIPTGYSGSLTAPASFSIEDGISSLPFVCELTPISIGGYTQSKLWAEVQLWASAASDFSNSVKVQSYPLGSRVASTENFSGSVTKETLTNLGFTTNSNIYFKVKAVDNFGTESSLSSINSAKIVEVDNIDTAVPTFSTTTQTVIGLVPMQGSVAVGWAGPDVDSSYIVSSQLRVQRVDAAGNILNTATKEFSVASSQDIITTSKSYTYRISVRYQNTFGWSAWYGLKSVVDTYATYFEGNGIIGVDTGVVPTGYINLSAAKLENAIQFSFSVTSNSSNNMKTAWGADVYYSVTEALLTETNASYVTASSLSLSWGSGDTVVTVANGTPASTWVGKWIYFIHPTLACPVQRAITAYSGQTITLNVSIGYAGSVTTSAYVITPLWERTGVLLNKIIESPEYAPLVSGKTYTFTDANFTSGQTIYGKCHVYNIYGMSNGKSMSSLAIGNFKCLDAYNNAATAQSAAEAAQSTADTANTTANSANSLASTVSTGTLDYRSANAPNGSVPSSVNATVRINNAGGLGVLVTFTYTNNGTKKADAFLFKVTGDSSNRFFCAMLDPNTSNNYTTYLPDVPDATSGGITVYVYPAKTTLTGMAIDSERYSLDTISAIDLYWATCSSTIERTTGVWTWYLASDRGVFEVGGLNPSSGTDVTWDYMLVGSYVSNYGVIEMGTSKNGTSYLKTKNDYFLFGSAKAASGTPTSVLLSLYTASTSVILKSVDAHLYLDTNSASYKIYSSKLHEFSSGLTVSGGDIKVGTNTGYTGNWTHEGATLTFNKGILTGVA